MPGRRALVLLRGDFQYKNLGLIHLKTGAEHQLTNLAPDFEMRDFDISPDGRELVVGPGEGAVRCRAARGAAPMTCYSYCDSAAPTCHGD